MSVEQWRGRRCGERSNSATAVRGCPAAEADPAEAEFNFQPTKKKGDGILPEVNLPPGVLEQAWREA